jgi:hypothetical protein
VIYYFTKKRHGFAFEMPDDRFIIQVLISNPEPSIFRLQNLVIDEILKQKIIKRCQIKISDPIPIFKYIVNFCFSLHKIK